MKQNVTLQFSSIENLVAFSRAALLRYYELNSNSCVLRSECSQEDIDLACTRYAAEVVQEGEERGERIV